MAQFGSRRLYALVALAVLTVTFPAFATDWAATSTSNATYDWTLPANWTTTPYPNATDAVANFAATIATASTTVTAQVPATGITVGTVTIGYGASGKNYNISAAGAGVLTFDVTSGDAILTGASQGSAANTISAPLQLNDTLDITNARAMTLSGSITTGTGTTGLVKLGVGSLVLSGTNTYNGTTTISAGEISFGASSLGGSGRSLVIQSGGLAYYTAVALDQNFLNRIDTSSSGVVALNANAGLANALNFSAFSSLRFGSAATRTYTGTLTPDSDSVYRLGGGGGSLTISSSLVGSNQVNVDLAGTVVLTGANTYTGKTTVGSTGALTFNTIGNIGAASSALGAPTVANQSIDLGGTLTYNGSTVAASDRDIALTAAGASVSASNAAGEWDINGIVSGAFALTKAGNGKVVLNNTNTYTGATTLSAGVLEFATIADTGTACALGIGNSISISSGGILRYTGTGATASTNRTITLSSGGTAVETVEVNHAGTTLTLNGSLGGGARNLKLGGSGDGVMNSVASLSGTATYPLEKAGTGTWTLTASNTVGKVGVTGGTLITNHNGTMGDAVSNTTVADGATLGFSGGITYSTAEPVTISGSGAAANGSTPARDGAIANISGSNSFAGPITLAAAAKIGAAASSTLNLTGGITNGGFAVTLGGSGNVNVSTAAITGAGGLTKNGAGTATLSGSHSFSGPTQVDDGLLVVSGVLTGSNVTVGPTGRLGGNGSVTLNTTVNGTLSPGNSPGSQTTGTATWGAGGKYLWEINDAAGTAGASAGATTGWDLYNVTGNLNIAATAGNPFTIQIASLTGTTAGAAANFDPTQSYSWTIATASSITGFSSDSVVVDPTGFTGGQAGSQFGVVSDGTSITVTYTPEPAALCLLAIGGLLGLRRRRYHA